jgi:peptide/nickel transport system permease protein
MPIWLNNTLTVAIPALLVFFLVRYLTQEQNRRAMQRFWADRTGIVCGAITAAFLLVGLLDCFKVNEKTTVLDFAFSNVPREESYSAPLSSTSFDERNPKPLKGWHLLGTDILGKDVLLQTLKAAKTALIIGGVTSLVYIPIGTVLGILAGYHRRWVDDVIQYIYSTLASIPGILLLISVLMILGKGLDRMAIALSITAWIGLCRLIRGETFRQAVRPYVDAARALGQSHWNIISRHILPNVMHLIIINAILGFSGLVMTESILSYLGVGAPVGTASWGAMIDQARMELSREPAVWWNISAASGALFLLVLSLNLLGDSLRRAFDPKSAT